MKALRYASSKRGIPLVQGTEIPLIKLPFSSLNIGSKIRKIGQLSKNGKQTSSSRVDEFSPYVVYAGKVMAPSFNGEGDSEMLCFRTIDYIIPTYILYDCSIPGDLVQWNFRYNYLAIFRAVFEEV